jgi:uncharacterized membrane protein HdeD (DUF308 family)
MSSNKGQRILALIFLTIHGIVSGTTMFIFTILAFISFYTGDTAFLYLIPLLTILSFIVSLMFFVKQKPEISSRISGITLILVALVLAWFAIMQQVP